MKRFSEEDRETIWDMREAGVPVKQIARHLGSQRELDAIARSLNTRPRQTLGWMAPSKAFANAVALTG